MRGEGREKLGVGLDPAISLQTGFGSNFQGQPFGGVNVAQAEIDAGNAADQIEQALRATQADIDIARIDALVAEVEKAGNGQRVIGAVAGVEAQLVADRGAEILASSMPITASPALRRKRPATIRSSRPMTRL